MAIQRRMKDSQQQQQQQFKYNHTNAHALDSFHADDNIFYKNVWILA